jgi:dipeptidyl aminopeptidase/acylaminoacyl peptidase
MIGEAAWRARFRAPQTSLPEWARDAPDRLIYVSNREGKVELYAWDWASGSRHRLTDRPEGTRLGAIEPGGELVWWFDDERGSEHGIWKVMPFAGGQARPAADLAPAYPAGLALGRELAAVGTSTPEGAEVWLTGAGGARLLYRHREQAEVATLSRDERLLALEHSEHGDSRHPALRVLALDGRTVADLWDGPGLGLHAGSWSPLPGDQRLIVIEERSGTPRPALWLPEQGRREELRLDLPGEVRASWYPDGTALLLHHLHRGRAELYRYSLAERQAVRLPVPDGWISEARIRPDGTVWYRHESGAMPPRLRADDRVLFEEEPAPPGAFYRDLEGAVPGFLARPPAPPPYPTVFWVHGGPEYLDADRFDPRVQAWVDHGFAVALVNYRGSTGYGRSWRDALEGNPGLTELQDLKAVRDRLVESGIADPGRLVLGGASWGGYLTLLGLGRQPEDWSLGVAAVPVADYVAAYEDEMEPLKAFDRSLFGGTPLERPDFYRERSPITYVSRLRAPVLILAGRNDPRCPVRQVHNYLARLRELGKEHEYYEFDAGHGSLRDEERIHQMELMLDFAHRHLATPAPR